MNKPLIALLLLIGLIASFSFLYLKTSAEKQIKTQKQVHVFKNFDPGTKITMSYQNKKSDIVQIINSEEFFDIDPFINNFYYAIQNDKSSYVVEIIKSQSTQFFISGLKPKTKVQITSHKNEITKALPADWAGRITLKPEQLGSKKPFCLTIMTNKTSQLCHDIIQEVTS